MADNYKPSVWHWVKEVVKQGATWVTAKVCQGIIFVVDGVAAVVEVVKETLQTAVEVSLEIVKRVRKNSVVQNIGKGVDTLRKLKDAKELPGAIRRTIKWVWALATGKACFSWAASSSWCTLCSAGYAILLVTTCLFSLYLLGLLSTVFRS